MTETRITIPEVENEITAPTGDELLVARDPADGEDKRLRVSTLSNFLIEDVRPELQAFVDAAEGFADDSQGFSLDAQVFANQAEEARNAAQLSRGIWPTTAAGMGNGVADVVITSGGTGGTNGTFPLAFSGGTQVLAPAGVFTVVGGVVVRVLITYSGYYSAGTPTLSFAASAGLTGTNITAVMAANTNVNEYFSVPVIGADESLILYRVDAGPVATEVTRYPASSLFSLSGSGFALENVDAERKAAIGVYPDGRTVLSSPIFRGDGAKRYKSALRFPGELIYINGAGQSNAQGTTGPGTQAISTTQQYGSLTCDTLLNRRGLYRLTSEYASRFDSVNGWFTENPIYGTVEFIQELMEKENGIQWQDNDVRFVGVNNGLAGQNIAQLSPGGSSGKYELSIDAAEVIAASAVNAGITPSFGMTTWAQGEANSGNSLAAYKSALISLANNYRTDGKIATGQEYDPIFVTWQLCEVVIAAGGVSQAQLEAGNEHPFIYCSGPTYHLPRFATDGTHFNPTGYKWLGAYFGLVYKRVVIDGVDWQPLQPVHHAVIGNAIDLLFSKTGLTFDTTGDIPAQTNFGFQVVDAANAPITVSSVAIVGTDRVRITCASAPQPGWKVRYGWGGVTGVTSWLYTGPGGNLRDNQGDYLTYDAISKPMHNWCCVFQYEV